MAKTVGDKRILQLIDVDTMAAEVRDSYSLTYVFSPCREDGEGYCHIYLADHTLDLYQLTASLFTLVTANYMPSVILPRILKASMKDAEGLEFANYDLAFLKNRKNYDNRSKSIK